MDHRLSPTVPSPLRTSKSAASRGTTTDAPTEERKGKKKASKRVVSTNAASIGRKKVDEGVDDALDQYVEDKAAHLKPKRTGKAAPPAESASTADPAAPTSLVSSLGSCEDLNRN